MHSELSPGSLLGPYELLLPLPRTGAAQVWVARLARASGFSTHLALKTIPRAYIDDLRTEHLLLEQAALAARIHHPNLVEMLDLGEQDETLYLALEWVDGVSLQRIFVEASSRGGVPLPIAVNLVGQLCRGLHVLHEHRDASGASLGAVHGHVSFQNLMVAYNGTAKLCDFGIAQALDRLSFLTRANQQNHKLTFAAPEQLNARPLDRRSDVFSAGALLYTLLTSRHPFEGADLRATLHNLCSNQPALPPGHSCPEALRHVLSKALRKTPDERFGSALELGAALEQALPDSFQASSEQAVAAYLEELCSSHKLDFQAQIRAAATKQGAGSTSVPVSAHISQPNSLRAVALDSPSDVKTELRRSRAGGRAASARRSLRVALVPTFALCLAVGFGFAWHTEKSPRPALASQGVAPGASVEPSPVPRAEAPLPAPEVTPAPEVISAGVIDVSDLPREATPTPSRARAAPVSRPSRSSPQRVALPKPDARAEFERNAARSAASTSSSGASRVAADATPAKLDAWDPSTFGGRH